jgi:hypothetical protein
VVGSTSTATSLWSPSLRQGNSGTVTEFLGAGHFYSDGALAINNYGQIAGLDSASTFPSSSFLWTPTTPNGVTGAAADAGTFLENVAINDYGQFAGESRFFTPLAPNTALGVLTAIPGIGTLVAMNNSGVILDSICPVVNGGCFAYRGFVWTPNTANGMTGFSVELLPPPGSSGIELSAVDSRGQIVGDLVHGYSVIPFLYRNGAFYNLAGLNSELAGGIPLGINERGQIIITTGGYPFTAASNIYLLTPSLAFESGVSLSVAPASGSGSNASFDFAFQGANGFGDFDVVNILIRDSLDGRNSCYLAYSRPLNLIYLVDDSGNVLSSGLPLGTTGGVGNSQCTLNGNGSTASTSQNALALTLNLSFGVGFEGNKIVYMAARDVAGNNSGWHAAGSWNVPQPAPPGPSVTSFALTSTSSSSGEFFFTFADTTGSSDLGIVNVLINDSLNGNQACYIAFSRPIGLVYLVNDTGTGLLPAVTLGSASVSNSQCTISTAGSSAVSSGNTLTVTLNLAFGPGFVGDRVIYAAARSNGDTLTSGWQAVGVVNFK